MSLGPTAPQVLVAVPVTRQARADKALVAVLSGDALPSVIWRHRLPTGASVYVLDASNAVVTRMFSGGNSEGQALDDEIAGLRREGWEGLSRLVTASGHSIYAAYARSPEWGWTATLIVPASTVDGSWRRWLAMVTGGGAMLLLLGVALALMAARGVALPIAALARSAEALGRGEAARSVPSGITELDEVGHAISEAATARQESARQLEIRAGQQAAIVALGQRALAGSDIGHLAGRCRAHPVLHARAPSCATSWSWTPRARRWCCARRWAARATSWGSPWGRRPRTRSPATPCGRASPWSSRISDGDAVSRWTVSRDAQASVSGVTVVIHGPVRPYGLLGVYSVALRAFTRDDVNFLQSIANILAAAMERTRAEAERTDLLRRERAARTEAEAASRAKDEFLAMLGHELRNPLAAIASASQVLEQQARERRRAQRRLTAIVARQARHLSRMVDDLLDVSRGSLGQDRAEPGGRRPPGRRRAGGGRLSRGGPHHAPRAVRVGGVRGGVR